MALETVLQSPKLDPRVCMTASKFKNPYRPGAGHQPPHLAGRHKERTEFTRLLDQEIILENPILTGLRGVGKTVLLDTFKPIAQRRGWLWAGTDLSESASTDESMLAVRVLTDVSLVSSSFSMLEENGSTKPAEHALDYCNKAPGLIADKLKAVLELVSESMPSDYRGIIFAYDEAQNLSDQAAKDQYPLSVLLEVFQSLQRKEIPFMLLLTGLPTLLPKLVEARTYAERMFHVLFLERLSDEESEAAIRKPLERAPKKFSDESVDLIRRVSGGYPYFIQFICREAYDVLLQMLKKGDSGGVPMREIMEKLDADFFRGRWVKASNRQRDFLSVIAHLPNADTEFSAQQVVRASKRAHNIKSFSPSYANQLLGQLADAGLVYKNRHGSYSLAVPMLDQFIRRQVQIMPTLFGT
jgi:hypothetical protein